MANISFYQYSGDSRVLSKTLSNPLTKNINIRTDIDIYNPLMILQDFDLAYNYMLWDNRYYFVNDARYTANKIWQLQCHIDVLMTYKDKILQSTATKITQAQNNNYLDGASIPITSKPSFQSISFPNEPFSYTVNNYILIGVAGKTA